MPGFSIHRHMGLEKSRVEELERFIIATMKDTQEVPKTIDIILKAKSIHSLKPLSQKERDYLLILLGIYVRKNHEMHEKRVLSDPNEAAPAPDSEDED